jgi:hypothetical protein
MILRKLHRIERICLIPLHPASSGAFISTKADAQIVAEVDSIDAWPAVEPRLHQAMSIAAIVACHNSLRVLSDLRHKREDAGVPRCQEKNLIPQRMRYFGLEQKTLASRPVQARQNWKEKELNEWSG